MHHQVARDASAPQRRCRHDVVGRGGRIARHDGGAPDEDFSEGADDDDGQVQQSADPRVKLWRNVSGSVCHDDSFDARRRTGVHKARDHFSEFTSLE